MVLRTILIAFIVTPLVCWALLARTKVLGWAFAGVLAACAATEGMLMAGWIFGGEKVALVTVLTVVTAVTLVVGGAVESREPDVPGRRSIRGRVGIGLSIFFYGLCCLVGLSSMIVNSAFPEMSVPSSARLLPLGAGLTVTGNTGSCGGGSATFCDRWIHIHRAVQVSEQDVLQQMRTKLTRQYGFDLISDGAGWAGCTDGSQRLCGEVDPDQGGVVIVLEASDECSVEEICETPPFSFGRG